MTKIMLVEDDQSLREIYSIRLTAEGYQIVAASDGEEALAMAVKEKPDLILSDVMMPKISGFDMLDILRSTPETKDIKVIMMTALSSEDQRSRGEGLGADRYLVKSQVGIEDVIQMVHEVLGDKAGAVAPADQSNTAGAPVQQPEVAQAPVAMEAAPVEAAPVEAEAAVPVEAAPVAPVETAPAAPAEGTAVENAPVAMPVVPDVAPAVPAAPAAPVAEPTPTPTPAPAEAEPAGPPSIQDQMAQVLNEPVGVQGANPTQ